MIYIKIKKEQNLLPIAVALGATSLAIRVATLAVALVAHAIEIEL